MAPNNTNGTNSTNTTETAEQKEARLQAEEDARIAAKEEKYKTEEVLREKYVNKTLKAEEKMVTDAKLAEVQTANALTNLQHDADAQAVIEESQKAEQLEQQAAAAEDPQMKTELEAQAANAKASAQKAEVAEVSARAEISQLSEKENATQAKVVAAEAELVVTEDEYAKEAVVADKPVCAPANCEPQQKKRLKGENREAPIEDDLEGCFENDEGYCTPDGQWMIAPAEPESTVPKAEMPGTNATNSSDTPANDETAQMISVVQTAIKEVDSTAVNNIVQDATEELALTTSPPIAAPTAAPTAAATDAAAVPVPTPTPADMVDHLGKLEAVPKGFIPNFNCANNKAWADSCEDLKEHCDVSVVTRMKCRKSCGSCNQQFPVDEPTDKVAREEQRKLMERSSMVFALKDESSELGENVGAKAKEYLADQERANRINDAKSVSNEGIINLPSYAEMMKQATDEGGVKVSDYNAMAKTDDDKAEDNFMGGVSRMWNSYFPEQSSKSMRPSSDSDVLDAASAFDQHDRRSDR